jgi:3-oxocholest-4-en-26-oyl-CoA dehydrogenase beta subunit
VRIAYTHGSARSAHRGMGVASEYTTHRYFIWAKQIEFMLGGATQQLLRIGATLAAEPA